MRGAELPLMSSVRKRGECLLAKPISPRQERSARVEMAIVLDDHLSGCQETSEVGLVVEAGGAEVGEMTHLHTGHLKQGVGSHLAEAET